MRYFLTVLTTTLMAWHSHAQVAMIILDDIPGNMKVCVTNYGPTIAAAELSIGVVSGRVSAIEGQVIKWNTAYGWGDHHQQGYATTQDVAQAIADMPPVIIPDEQDPRAMSLFHYGDPDIEITPESDFTFNAASGTITGYTGTDEDIVVPYEINGVPVVALGNSAFNGNEVIRKLLAPKTLTIIGSYAFNFSSLNTLIIPSLTSIGGYAFADSPLTALTAPSLTSIGNNAFSMSSLASLEAPALTSIGDFAFAGSSLATLALPALTNVGDYAFADSSLTTLTAPSLTSIDNEAFAHSSLKTLAAPSLTSIGDFAFSYGTLTTLVAPELTSIGDFAFEGSSLTSLVAPSLTYIGDSAFASSSLTSLVAPSLTYIGDSAFVSSALTTVYYGGNQPTAGENIYDYTPANLVSYVTDPTATGWGDTFGDRPVVRLPLYADEVYSGGSLVSTVSPSSPWTTNIVASGAQTLKGTWGSQPRLQLSGSTTIDIDWTTYDTNGINRISLTIVSGEHPVIWSTNNFEFAEAPELSTNAPNTILIRKIGAAKAQGRQL